MSNEVLKNKQDENNSHEEISDSFFGSLINVDDTKEMQNEVEANKEQEENDDSLLFCLSAPVQLMESTNTSRDKEDMIQSEPINHFYFCSGNCLTTGFGTKIECNQKTGKLAPEGEATLRDLKFYKNGKELSMEQKIQLVRDCCARRNAYDRSHRSKLCNAKLTDQKNVLFGKQVVTVSKQSAIDAALKEYEKKQEKLLKNNPHFKDNLILLALGSDIAYQYGDKGVTRTNLYKSVKKGVIPLKANFGHYGDRTVLRQWLLETAYQFDQEAKKRGNQPASPESQKKIFMNSLKSFAEKFHKQIMCRQEHTTLLMEKSMALVITQNFCNIYGKQPGTEEMKKIQDKAQKVVYDTLFHSKTLREVPDKYRPYALLNTIANASTGSDPISALNKAAEKAAQENKEKMAKKQEQKSPHSANKVTLILKNNADKYNPDENNFNITKNNAKDYA